MKKLISAILAAGCLFSMTALAADEITVLYNDAPVVFDVAPYIDADAGRTMVPMRAIFEAVGANVTWDDETKTVIADRTYNGETSIVVLQIGTETAFKNSDPVVLDTPAVIVDSRTFVPLRFVSEALGNSVEWDGETKTVTISSTVAE